MATRQQISQRKLSLRNELTRTQTRADLPLPPVRELATRHLLSNRIVHQELQKLAQEGAVYTIPRVGTFSARPVAKRVESRINTDKSASDVITLIAGNGGQLNPQHRQPGWADYIAWGALSEIRRLRCHAMVLDTERLLEDGLDQLDNTPRGIIVCTVAHETKRLHQTLEELAARGTHMVMFGEDNGNPQYDRVLSDHEAGAFALTKWLITQGSRRILFTRAHNHNEAWVERRFAGYLRAHREAGLPPLEQFIYDDHSPAPKNQIQDEVAAFKSQARKMAKTLRLALGEHEIDALMALSDGAVSFLAQACRECKKEPNRDIAIVGYDNYWRDSMEIAPIPFAPLATVDKCNPNIGAAMVRLMLERMEGQLPPEAQQRVVAPHLVVLKNP